MNNVKETIMKTLWTHKVIVAITIFIAATIVTIALAALSGMFEKNSILFNTIDKLSTAASYISAISLVSIVFVIGEILRGDCEAKN